MQETSTQDFASTKEVCHSSIYKCHTLFTIAKLQSTYKNNKYRIKYKNDTKMLLHSIYLFITIFQGSLSWEIILFILFIYLFRRIHVHVLGQ